MVWMGFNPTFLDILKIHFAIKALRIKNLKKKKLLFIAMLSIHIIIDIICLSTIAIKII